MSIAEWHELFKIVFLVFGATLVAFAIFAKWLEFTYKKAHKKSRKVQKTRKTTIVYDLGDTRNMTLYEIKQMKENMRKELIANV
jgi:membrane peptidoglycan carboxypeptidase